MIVSIIAAVAKNRVIGINNHLPWKLPADTAYFKNTIKGHSVIMGRKSFEAEDAEFTNQKNIILTRQDHLELPENCYLARDLEQALDLLKDEAEIFILGGESIYEMALPQTDRLYLTHIEAEFEGDTYFPEVNWAEWQLLRANKHQADANNPYPYSFNLYGRKQT